MQLPTSTYDHLETGGEARRAIWSRRGLLVALFGLVGAGAVGLLGDTDVRKRASGGGYDLELFYPRSARAGLDVPWEVTVRHPGGFAGDNVTLAVTGTYFDIYETQGFHPDPTESTRDGRWLYLSFTKPDGDTLVVAYDAYIQPSSQRGRSGTLAVVADGRRVVSLDFETTLLP